MNQGWIGVAGFKIPPFQADAQGRVKNQRIVKIRFVERMIQIGKDTDFKLQALAFVNGHNTDNIRRFRKGGGSVLIKLVFFHMVQVP